MRPLLSVLLLTCAATRLQAQELAVYDDALQSGFANYSYGGVPGDFDFASTTQAHAGVKSIAFVGDSFNALAFAQPTTDFTTAQYPALHLWVHGGAAGGQQLRLYLGLDSGAGNVVVAQAPLDSYITGGSIIAGAWREVIVPFGQAPLSYSGAFDRIDLQSDVAGSQPVLYVDDVRLTQLAAPAASLLQIERDVSVGSMLSDRFTWQDAAGKPRVAVLAHNDGPAGPDAGVYPNHGGSLREFRYQLPGGATRVAGVTTYGNGGYGGFGYVVSHRADGSAGGIGDDSPLGYAFPGTFQRVFEGRHHAIFRFSQLYPRHSSTTANPANQLYNVPVTIDWVFATGRDNPTWSVTWDLSGVPADALEDDSRAPYGELNIDGVGAQDISGVAWGDRFKFASTTAPVTLDSSWTWNVANTVPYVKLWIASTDATMGIVQTRTLAQQDAGAGRGPFNADLRPFWGTTSANGNAGGPNVMPWQDAWPYQANSFSIGPAPNSNNNARLTWGAQYGFLGQQSYDTRNGLVPTASGWPKQSYSAHIVLGTHSAGPVEAQVAQVETVQTLALSTTIGAVATTGPAGIGRSDVVPYAPAGYNHVYGALAFVAAGNALDANVGVGAGTLRKPLVVVSNYTSAGYPTVKLAGATLAQDVDYFPSLRQGANELWLTLNRDLGGATNHLEVLGGPPPPPLSFYTLVPCRVIDTRSTSGPEAGAPSLSAGATRTVAIAPKCSLPASAKAISANMTVTGAGAPGYLTLYPADASGAPLASNINFRAGVTRANNAVLALAADGSGIKVLNGSAASVDFILDVNGWFE